MIIFFSIYFTSCDCSLLDSLLNTYLLLKNIINYLNILYSKHANHIRQGKANKHRNSHPTENLRSVKRGELLISNPGIWK